MACRTAFRIRSVFITEPWIPLHQNRAVCSLPVSSFGFSKRKPCRRLCRSTEARDFHSARPSHLNCSYNEDSAASGNDLDRGPPQEAVLKAIIEVSKTEGRVGQTTNMVIGGTVADDSTDEWLALDKKVNSYPTVRGFTAIGTGGDDFVQSMVVAVESVIQQPIPKGNVKQNVSSRGKYVSVKIGPVRVVSSEQVREVYIAMRRDVRMKYFL